MRRILLPPSSLLAACAPAPENAAMPRPDTAATPPAPTAIADSPAAALGRRTLSTAFVRIGPDGYLTVERHDGRTVILRDVIMQRGDYCGVRVGGDAGRGKYCGGYAEVAGARPGGAPAVDQPASASDR